MGVRLAGMAREFVGSNPDSTAFPKADPARPI
jgi:hypothetical protein